ncbi:unnamed protein product [Wuchereria bancrofti]|nr:unnamed protein product [Wuchereria bancrofti]
MHLAQKELKKLRLDVDKKTKAAYIIQSYYRGYVSRKSDRNTNEQQSTGEKVTEERNSNKSLKILTNSPLSSEDIAEMSTESLLHDDARYMRASLYEILLRPKLIELNVITLN